MKKQASARQVKTDAVELPEMEIEFLNPADGEGKTIPLKRPLKINGESLTEIIVPVKLTGDLNSLAKSLSGAAGMPEIIAAYCEKDIRIINALAFEDFDPLQTAVLDFLPPSIREGMEKSKAQVLEQLGLNAE